jgi:hypothetical protein
MTGLSAHQLLRFHARLACLRIVRARVLPLVLEIILEDQDEGIRWFVVRGAAQGTVLYRRDASPDAAPRASISDTVLANVVGVHGEEIAAHFEQNLAIDRAALAAIQLAIEEEIDTESREILLLRRWTMQEAYEECARKAAEVLAWSSGSGRRAAAVAC